MRRTIKKQFWFNKKEAELLQKKAKKACLTEAALVRKLVRDESIKEQPKDEFYDAMRQLEGFSNSVRVLANNVHSMDMATEMVLEREVARWHRFQADIEEKFLMPDREVS